MLSDEEIVDAVQAALHQLYDTQALRSNPLIQVLGLSDAPRAVSELRQIITEAIQSLRPDETVPADAGAWRVYEILEYRFLQQVGQAEVAKQLGLSVRHLRREERRAAEMLAQALRPRLINALSEQGALAADAAVRPAGTAVGRRDLAWLDDQAARSEVNLADALVQVIKVTQPLAAARQITVELDAPQTTRVAVQAVAVRQMVLELLTVAIRHAITSPVKIRLRRGDDAVVIEVEACWGEPSANNRQDFKDTLQMTRQIASRCDATVEATLDACSFRAQISLTLPQDVPVLVIDDNEDTLRLLRRYTMGTSFRIMAASTLSQALDLAAQTRPHIIVLDVLMPHVDGWELLARLRQHPLTMDAPVLICSILTQEDLALSLGASEYLRKPVTRQAFLQALERHRHRGAPALPPAS